MKVLMIITSLFLAAHSKAAIVECAGKIHGQTEFFRARVNEKNRLVWWSKNALIDARTASTFAWLSDMEKFGLEGSGSFYGKNGYSILSVTNTAETVTIGVSPQLNLAFYSYRDNGSGNGNSQVPMSCRVLPKAPAI
jgi:hypothetical protein